MSYLEKATEVGTQPVGLRHFYWDRHVTYSSTAYRTKGKAVYDAAHECRELVEQLEAANDRLIEALRAVR